jgi:putative FmdB family regulatory protein
MPNYDYQCTQCGYQEEILQKMTDVPLTTCSQCQQATFKRKFGRGIGLQFQGSGFYSTDYHPSSEKEPPAPSTSKNCGCGKSSCSN